MQGSGGDGAQAGAAGPGAGGTTSVGGAPGVGGGSAGAPGVGGGSGGSGPGNVGDPCTYGAMNTCAPGLYCDALGCGAGTCAQPLPLPAQQKIFDPVCGCDGVSYFNATIGESKGAAISHAGACLPGEAIACVKGVTPCGVGIFCSAEVATIGTCPNTPNQAVPGTCWGVPLACDVAGPKGRGCVPPGQPCADTCSLIQSQNAWHADATCP
jgi:hypothetical protein